MNKKYRSTIKIRSDKEKLPFIKSIARPELKDYRDIIEDYIYVSRKRFNNKLAMLFLQLNIFKDLNTYESSIKKLTDILNKPDKIKDLYPEINNIEEQINFWEQELNSNKIIVSALRSIGDSLLWRLLEFNISLIYIISSNLTSGFIDLGKLGEVYSFGMELYNDNSKYFVLNSITNIGTISDMVIKNYDSSVDFIEIKSTDKIRGTDKRERIQRQNERLKNLESLANTGRGKIGANNVFIKVIPGKPKLMLDVILELINKSKETGMVHSLIKPYLGLIIYYYGIGLPEDKFTFHHKSLKDQLVDNDNEKVIILDSMNFIEFSRIKIPYSIYPYPPDIIADILCGKIIIEYFLNINKLFKDFKLNNIDVVESVLDKEKINPDVDYMCKVKYRNWTIDIPPQLINRLMFEVMAVEDLTKIFDNLAPSDKLYKDEVMLFRFEKENTYWI